MELIGELNKQSYKIHVDRDDEHGYTVTIDDRTYSVNCLELMPNVYSMLHGDDSYEVRVHKDEKSGLIETNFHHDSFRVDIADPMKRLLEESLGGGKQGDAVLEAPMPGKVLRLLVKEGDEVEEDQGLAVLVAMKMENELGSPKAGVVKKILVKEEDSVEGSTPLIIVG